MHIYLCLNSRAKTGVLRDQVNPLWAALFTNSPELRENPNNRQSASPYPLLGQDRSQEGGLQANLQTLNRKWLGSRQYEFNKMFKEAGGAVESPLRSLSPL